MGVGVNRRHGREEQGKEGNRRRTTEKEERRIKSNRKEMMTS